MQQRNIILRGVEVHNLQGIDVDLPLRKLIVFCGVSGSGKSSLAFDTLYAECQRRYIESFSAYTRQFLERLEKPQAEKIENVPPAIAVAGKGSSRSSRSTVGTATEIADYLRLLYAKIGQLVCIRCGTEVRRHTPQSTAEMLRALPEGTRYLLAWPLSRQTGQPFDQQLAALREQGFVRVILGERLLNLDRDEAPHPGDTSEELLVVIDRLTAGRVADDRLRDSLESAFRQGLGRAVVLVEQSPTAEAAMPPGMDGKPRSIDGAAWQARVFSNRLQCEACGIDYPEPEPRLFSFNSPLGACPTCEGFGNVMELDMELIVPDQSKSLRDGAIAPWNTPAYEHEKLELLALANDYDLPVDVPYSQLDARQRQLIYAGVPERKFGGLRGFIAWLERKKYKMHVRVFLSRWRSYRVCPDCHGSRLRPEALAARVGGKHIAEISAMKIADAARFFRELLLDEWQQTVGRTMLKQLAARLGYLVKVGLDYLTLDRTLRTLSGGELRRVWLTTALGSSLVSLLYVLDEPSIGLHPQDTDRLIEAVTQLRDRGNTVVVVEHEEAMIRAADQVVEIGPGAGDRGGQVVFQGTPAEMQKSTKSLTGDFLAGRRAVRTPTRRRDPNHGWIRLAGARGHNLKNVTVEIPLGMLCVVTGVSGSGKSTLVQDTLYPALCRRMKKDAERPCDYDDVYGDGQINDVILVDQSPIGRSPRSNPVTYIKAFDEIRQVFASTVDAKTRNYPASHFSFNVEGGRCEMCQGDGQLAIDMQFLADVTMRCPQCQGRRYRREILEVAYRGRSISDVLEMTVREAFIFFRGRPKVQARLKKLMDVGLDYLRLGQPANTLSGGEAQRLKLAGYVASARRGRTLFLLDEPTTGLHFSDVLTLLDCFEALLAVGHSLLVIEHNLQVIKCADWIIDLGPGAAEQGGTVVATGTPEEVARSSKSITARYLAAALAEPVQEQSV